MSAPVNNGLIQDTNDAFSSDMSTVNAASQRIRDALTAVRKTTQAGHTVWSSPKATAFFTDLNGRLDKLARLLDDVAAEQPQLRAEAIKALQHPGA